MNELSHLPNESLFYQVFYHAPIGMVLVSPDGGLLQANPSFCRGIGYSPDECRHYSILDLTHPEDEEISRLHMNRLLKGLIDSYQLKKRYIHKLGHPVWKNTHVALVRDEQNQPAYFIGQILDPEVELAVPPEHTNDPDQFRILHGLSKSDELYQLLSSHGRDIIFSCTSDCVCRYVSPAIKTVLGYEVEEINHTSLMQLIHPDEQQAVLARDYAKENLIACRIRHKSGEYIWMEMTTKAIFHPTEQSMTIIGVARDLTERKRAEKLMVESEKLSVAGQLAAGIAHEIRNPLTSLKGFIQLLQSGAAEKQIYYTIMLSELERIQLIISELLLLAKPQISQMKRIELVSILQHVQTLIESLAHMYDVHVISHLPDEPIWIHGDENQLKQVFVNLMKNAIESMPDGGELFLEVMPAKTDVIIRILDQGSGIPEEVMRQIGQPFFTTKENGTGLGLLVSYNMIENHKGSIEVESILGVGTTFSITLPLVPMKMVEGGRKSY